MAVKKLSVFEQARQAKPRTETYRIPLIDHDDAEQLWTDLTTARQQVRQAELFGTDPGTDKATVERLEERFTASFRPVTFRGLPAVDFDTLATKYPEPGEGETPPDDHVPFVYRLAEASCVGDGADTTAEQWQTLCEQVWPIAEANEFRQVVLNANQQPYSVGLGKG